MAQKIAFTILAITLISAIASLGIIKGNIAGSAAFTIRPSCPAGYNNIQSRTDPMPNYCFPGTNRDGSQSTQYMCCNQYIAGKDYAKPKYYRIG